MRAAVDKIRNEVLGLSASERASLAHDLILSLDDVANLSLDAEQEHEVQRRVRMVREGKATGRPADAVFASDGLYVPMAPVGT